MEDNTSQSRDSQQYHDISSATPVPNSLMIVPRPVNDDVQNISLTEHDGYLSHIDPLHSNTFIDPNLNLNDYDHGHVLQYFAETSNDRLRYIKRSKAVITPSSSNITTYDPHGDINFFYGLISPPTTIRQSIPSQMNNNFVDTDWNGRILLPTNTTSSVIDNIIQEHQLRKVLR
jgi:hypothetical protein